MDQLHREAVAAIPPGHYILKAGDKLRPSDLVWSWTTKEFLPASSLEWFMSPFSDPIEEMVCVVRRAGLEGFEASKRRVFTVKL